MQNKPPADSPSPNPPASPQSITQTALDLRSNSGEPTSVGPEPPNHAAATPRDTQGPKPTPSALNPVDVTLPAKPTPEKSSLRTVDRPSAPDGRWDATGPKRNSSLDAETELRKVRLDEIDGIDEDIEQFLLEHDVLTDVGIQVDRWSQPMIRCAVQCLHLPLWVKRNRLVHLGSGKALTLARRLARYDEMLPATIIQAKSLSLQQKLTFVAHELLFQPALHRPAAGYPSAATALWRALDRAGVAPLKRPELRDFAMATGMSISALKQHWPEGEDQ